VGNASNAYKILVGNLTVGDRLRRLQVNAKVNHREIGSLLLRPRPNDDIRYSNFYSRGARFISLQGHLIL
jgi:hypothetical protein